MSKTIEQIRKELDENIPRDVISERPGGSGGKKLSYLEGWYVIDRLNQIFGQGNWSYRTEALTKTFEGQVNGKNYVSYIATVSLTTLIPNAPIVEFTDVGFGDGTDANNPGKCHELAVKEAVTDAIKRCAKSLGRSMGLALYDKSQEYVDNARPALAVKGGAKPLAPEAAVAVGSNSIKDPEALKAVIRESVLVLDQLDRKANFKTEFKKRLQSEYGVDMINSLSAEQANQLYNKIRTEHPKLNLN